MNFLYAMKVKIYDISSSNITTSIISMTINDTEITPTNEYKFNLDIEERKATYLLKEKNMSFDIDVEKIEYKKENNKIVLEYKISSDEETFKIEINEEDDINE